MKEMKTRVLPADDAALEEASRLLKAGELVGFPTETVYGLGADALNPEAVKSIFAAKDRPADNPLIVHIWSRDQLAPLCEIPSGAARLMDAFWPGPLTLLFPRKSVIPDVVTAGLETVAIRMPSHPVAAALLKRCGLPVAAPSANRSGRPSPTAAAHVLEDMDGRIPLILDGGSCQVGLESTVLDLCHGAPTILRPGGVTKEMAEEALGQEVHLTGSILRPLRENETARSPGMRYKHYAPKAQVTLVEGPEDRVPGVLRAAYCQDAADGKKTCVLCFSEHAGLLSDCSPHVIGSRNHPEEIAHRLFDTLRRLDEEGMETVYSEVLPPEGIGLAVMNRLGRAAAFRTIYA